MPIDAPAAALGPGTKIDNQRGALIAGGFGPRGPKRLSGWLPGPGAVQEVCEGRVGPKITGSRRLAAPPGHPPVSAGVRFWPGGRRVGKGWARRYPWVSFAREAPGDGGACRGRGLLPGRRQGVLGDDQGIPASGWMTQSTMHSPFSSSPTRYMRPAGAAGTPSSRPGPSTPMGPSQYGVGPIYRAGVGVDPAEEVRRRFFVSGSQARLLVILNMFLCRRDDTTAFPGHRRKRGRVL